MKIRIRIKPSLEAAVELDSESWYISRIFSVDQLLDVWDRLREYGFYWIGPYDLTKSVLPLTKMRKYLRDGGEAYLGINPRSNEGNGVSTVNKRGLCLYLYSEAQDFENNKHKLTVLPICSLLNNEIKLI